MYNPYTQTEDVICNPRNPHSKKITGHSTSKKQAIPLISVGNYARSSQLFEAGFSGFMGLTITSPV